MFSGIVEALGEVQNMHDGHISVSAPFASVLRPGDSVCVNGACLTVTSALDGAFDADVMPETLSRTAIGTLHAGDPVNLERSLSVGDRLGGHVVTGHVDAVGTVCAVRSDANARLVTVSAPPAVMALTAVKGSVAVDGISLTVVDVFDYAFSVSLIPHTLEHTTAGRWGPGSAVNLECDVLARYVQRVLAAAAPPPPAEVR